MLAAATPTPATTDGRIDDVVMQPDTGLSVEAVARAYARSLEGLPEDERQKSRISRISLSKSARFSHLKRHFNTTHCACSQQAATGKGPQLASLAKILVGEGLPVRQSHQKNNLDNYHGQRRSVEIWTVDARHNS